MTQEYIYERDRDLLDYFRNNITDPLDRTTPHTDTFTAGASQTKYTLSVLYVKNVADTITVNGVTKRKGFDYYITYGEGKNPSFLNLRVAPTTGHLVVVTYHVGTSIVEREFSRTDSKLPRVVMKFLTGSEEYTGLGDQSEEGIGSYFVASYVFEVRAQYASQGRELLGQTYNLARKLRRLNPYRHIISKATDVQTFDYDKEKDAYVWIFTLDITWDMLME